MSKVAPSKTTAYQKGVWAEERAAAQLMMKGYKILAKRYKTRYGEIDLIVRKGDVIVFVEVKIRADISDALYAITPKNRRRVEQAASYYIAQNPELSDYGMRFDVMAFAGKGGGIWAEHLDNAWELGA